MQDIAGIKKIEKSDRRYKSAKINERNDAAIWART